MKTSRSAERLWLWFKCVLCGGNVTREGCDGRYLAGNIDKKGYRPKRSWIENLVTDFRFIKFEMTVGSWNRPNGYIYISIYIYIYIYIYFFFFSPLSIIINEGEAEVKLRVYAVGLSRDRRSKSYWMI